MHDLLQAWLHWCTHHHQASHSWAGWSACSHDRHSTVLLSGWQGQGVSFSHQELSLCSYPSNSCLIATTLGTASSWTLHWELHHCYSCDIGMGWLHSSYTLELCQCWGATIGTWIFHFALCALRVVILDPWCSLLLPCSHHSSWLWWWWAWLLFLPLHPPLPHPTFFPWPMACPRTYPKDCPMWSYYLSLLMMTTFTQMKMPLIKITAFLTWQIYH